MAYTNVTNVAATLGRPITTREEIAQVNAWITGCELKIRSRLGDLSLLDPDVLAYVIAEAVARRARNPDGKQNERIDDYSYGLTQEAARAEIYLTDDEWAMLTPAVESNVGMAGNLTGHPGYGTSSDRGWWV